ncbi:MAG TPA: nitroreductase/quinone reductase family protein [Acidimicrobiales bacterium]
MSDPPFCYLTTTGRRTGTLHTVEIWFGREPAASTLYLLSGGRDGADWVRNARAQPDATVRVGGRDAPEQLVTVRVLDPQRDADEDALARRLLVEKYETPGAGDLDRWGRTSLAVALDVVAT